MVPWSIFCTWTQDSGNGGGLQLKNKYWIMKLSQKPEYTTPTQF